MTDRHTQPEHYEAQLATKAQLMTEKFAPFSPPELEVFASPAEHYRLRAEFRVWHEGEDLYYIMFDQETKQKYRVDQFKPASQLINQFMPLLLESIKHESILRRKLFQVDFLSTMKGELLISMLYHKPLDEAWESAARTLKNKLSETSPVSLIGRARKKKIVLDQDFVIESFPLRHATLHYKQVENSFTQPNGVVATHMLEWAVDCTRHSQGDLLELYCGNGNFSIALAENFERVLATEISKSSVDSAQYNIARNETHGVQVIRLSAEEFTQAMNKERTFRRLEGIDLDSYQCETILVDPPRSGLDEETTKMIQAYPKILYISCNPDTLAHNLETLTQTHQISKFALFDQFPYTHHAEVGVWLERK